MASENIKKLAALNNKPDSDVLHRILERAMTDEEAGFILALPASPADLAAKFHMSENAAEEKIRELARRGLVVRSRKGYRYPRDLGTLHDNILASDRKYIPAGIEKLWMDLYEGQKWWREVGESLAAFGVQVIRVIPAEKSISPKIKLLPHESITAIIEANRDLITIRNCCCRTGAGKCHHPLDVCMQFKGRAEYDLFRESGRKVSADEAVSVALKAVGSGLVPTVTNISAMAALEFICFCCGDCCLVLDPIIRLQRVTDVLAPSRFEPKVNYELCNGCGHCVPRCHFRGLEMKPVPGHSTMKAVLDPDKCVGCGVCELACVPGAIIMELTRPPEFIPEKIAGPSAIVHS